MRGLPSNQKFVQLDTHRVHYDEVTIVGLSGSDLSNMAMALDMMAKGLIDPGNYIAKCGGLDSAISLIKGHEEEDDRWKGRNLSSRQISIVRR